MTTIKGKEFMTLNITGGTEYSVSFKGAGRVNILNCTDDDLIISRGDFSDASACLSIPQNMGYDGLRLNYDGSLCLKGHADGRVIVAEVK